MKATRPADDVLLKVPFLSLPLAFYCVVRVVLSDSNGSYKHS